MSTDASQLARYVNSITKARGSPWVWIKKLRRYRNTKTGRFIGLAGMLKLRDRFVDAMLGKAADVAKLLKRDRTQDGINKFVGEARSLIKSIYVDQYILGHGGRGSMTQADYGRLGAMLRKQYSYLDRFAGEIADGKYLDEFGELTDQGLNAISNRLGLYVKSSTAAYERGKTLGMGCPELPAYPGDGNSECLTNCRCTWDIVEFPDRWEATWRELGDEGTCDTCDYRGSTWNPLVLPKLFPDKE